MFDPWSELEIFWLFIFVSMSTLNFKSQAKKQCSSFLLLDSKKLIYSGKTRIQRDFCRDYGQRKVSNKKNYMVYHTVVIRDKCLLKISKLKSLSLLFIFASTHFLTRFQSIVLSLFKISLPPLLQDILFWSEVCSYCPCFLWVPSFT